MAYTVSFNNTSQHHSMKIKSNTSLSLRKFLLSALVAAPLATLPAPLWALPVTTGGNVTSSSATTTFQTNTPANTVLSITDPVATRLVLRWIEFGSGGSPIAGGDTVIWNLPSTSSAVLNIVSTGATTVNGTLQSNGSIFILNTNGIIINGTVTAAGFGASTISEPEFFFANNGNLSYVPAATPTNNVAVNSATITVGTTGSVYLAGRNVDVSGTINAGSLNITAFGVTPAETGVRLGQTGALTLGVAGTAATLIDPAIPGTGNLTINSNGAPVAVTTGANVTSILGGNATITTTGNSTVGNGAITQGAGLFSVGDGVNNSLITLNTGTGSVTLGNVSGNGQRNNFSLQTGVTSITTVGRVALNASTITGNTTINPVALSVTAGASSLDSAGDVTVTGGTIALQTNANNSAITFKGPGDLVFSGLITNASTSAVTVTSTTGSVTLPGGAGAFIGGALTVTAQTNIVQSAGALVVGSGGVNRVASFDAVTGSVTLTNVTNDFTRVQIKNAPSGASIVDANAVIIANATNATGAVTISTVNGPITFGAGADETTRFTNNLTLNAGSGAAAAGVVTAGGSGYTAPVVTLSAPNIVGGTQAIANATFAGGIITGIVVTTPGTGYSTPPTVTITDPAGVGAAATLPLLTSSTIADANDNNTIIGALNLNAGGAITLNGATSNTVGLNNQFGQVNATTGGALTVYESTTLNLGTIRAASLRAYGVAGLIQSGSLTLTGAAAVGAGTGAAPGDISLTNSSNSIGGAISLLDDFGILNNTGPNGTVIGNYLGRNLTIVNGTNTTIGAINGTAENGLTGNLTVTATGGTNAITFAGITNVSGTGGVTLNAPGNITATNTNSKIARVTVTSGGNIDFRSTSNVTVNATLTQATAGATASFTSQNGITIGTFNSDYTGTVRFNAAANNRPITDSVNGIRIFGPVQFTSNGAVTINRSGHSFGGVTIATNSNASATIVESGGLRLVDVNINGSGSFTATSTTGDILEDTGLTGAGVRFTNGNSSATFNAPLGRVLLTDGRNNLAGRINATALGDVIIVNSRDVILGNITTMGKLTVDKSATGITNGVNIALATGGTGYTSAPTVNITAPNLAGGVQATATANRDTVATSATFQQITSLTVTNPGSGYTVAPVITITGGGATVDATVTTSANVFLNGDITQFAGSRLNVFDTVTLRTNGGGAGAVTIGNTGNRMGGVVASSGTGTITLTEESTLNLKSINTGGSLNATSELNNIIDSTDANIVASGAGYAPIANSIVVAGTAAFAAPNGSVTLGLGASNYNVVGFTASGNVTVTDTIGNTTLGTSSIGGTLDVLNTVANATLNQNGAVKAQGNTTFTTNTGTIDLGNTGNEFGALRFTGNQVAITENTTMNLRGGSVANGPAVLSTNGNFVTSGVGGSSFIGSLSISAPNGSITPGAGSLLVVGTFSVFSNVLKDLSALSKSGNLTNKDPQNLGSGTYLPPGP
jgi:hypothetical protein